MMRFRSSDFLNSIIQTIQMHITQQTFTVLSHHDEGSEQVGCGQNEQE